MTPLEMLSLAMQAIHDGYKPQKTVWGVSPAGAALDKLDYYEYMLKGVQENPGPVPEVQKMVLIEMKRICLQLKIKIEREKIRASLN